MSIGAAASQEPTVLPFERGPRLAQISPDASIADAQAPEYDVSVHFDAGTVRVRSYETPIILAEPGTVLIEIPDGRTIAVSLR